MLLLSVWSSFSLLLLLSVWIQTDCAPVVCLVAFQSVVDVCLNSCSLCSIVYLVVFQSVVDVVCLSKRLSSNLLLMLSFCLNGCLPVCC